MTQMTITPLPRARPFMIGGPLAAPVLRALLRGEVVQQRRALYPSPELQERFGLWFWSPPSGCRAPGASPDAALVWPTSKQNPVKPLGYCPYGGPGSRLWVQEAHTFCMRHPFAARWSHTPEESRVLYRADGDWRLNGPYGFWSPSWRSPLQMPRWASRFTVEVVDLRVEPLQDLSEADARAEGIEHVAPRTGPLAAALVERPYALEFALAWDLAHAHRPRRGARPWAENPWMWVLALRRLEVPDGSA